MTITPQKEYSTFGAKKQPILQALGTGCQGAVILILGTRY